MPSGFDVGSLVWIDGENGGFPVPGHVVAVSGTSLKVQNDQTGKVCSVPAKLAIQRIDNGRHGMEDMIKLDDLNEGSILYNLAIRYEVDLIYTYIGKILVAVNPYTQHDIYTDEIVEKYTEKPIGSLPPHIFAIGSAAYSENQKSESNQVVVISGESGAGKTESAKLLIQYLATVNKNRSSLITEQIVEATPLLESFGNAKTVKNDNSSRFGKYLEIYFGSSGVICGGRISEYLLERSRIVVQASEERNYHIFYEMLAGLPQETKNKLLLTKADDYFYLNQGQSSVMPKKNDTISFNHVLTAMDVLDVTPVERDGIFTILAAILHLGNAGFYKGLASTHDVAVLRDEEEARVASQLLGLEGDDVINALTHKNTEARGEQISSPRNTQQAIDARDAIAKELYSRVFTWLVNKINGIVFHGKQGHSIAILDIFGFEDFRVNSFEQLCINYANESLHFFLNQFIFKMEQDEYKLEGIHWRELEYNDNQACLDLLARPPFGILHLLTDETNFPKATDSSFLEKCHQHHKSSKAYLKPKMQVPEFGISHFAGPVTYQVYGFLDKNRDGLKQDLTDLLCKCRSEFIKDLIPDLMGNKEMQIGGLKLRHNTRVNSLKAPSNSVPKNTVCAKFNDSLIRLVVAMKKCNPFFIRCIRPNTDKSPSTFIDETVIQQLRYCGVLETVKIRKNGYPVRIVYQDFIKRYRCLSNQLVLSGATAQQNCGIILNFMQADKDKYQFGHSKLFLREDLENELEEARTAKRMRMAVLLQAKMRGYVVNQQYLKMKKATIVLQSQTRRYLARKKYLKARKGFIMLQALYRLKRRKTRQLKSQNVTTDDQPQTVTKEEQTAEAQRVAMETKEWEKQALVDATHLEIPAELAMVYSHLQGWQVPYDRSIGLTNNDVIHFTCPLDDLPSNIDQYLFSKYAQENFQDHKFRVTRGLISNSLLKLKYSDAIEAVEIFKLIMRFMEDTKLTEARRFVLGNYIVQKGIFNPHLRDEIFCQLCNQTWGNPIDDQCDKAWLLLALCLCCFRPSDSLYNYLLKFCSDQAYNGYKVFCQHKLLCWKGRKRTIPRALPPSALEWEAAKKKAAIAVKCDFVDGEKRMVEVESCTTGEQLAATLLKDRDVSDSHGWTVDVYDPDCHFSLSGHNYVMDVLTEQEYPPSFPAGISPALITLRPANKLTEHRKRTLSDLHRPHSKRAKVAEIAHKFSFSERPTGTPVAPPAPPAPPAPGLREDALSAATSARISMSTYYAPTEDRLVAQTVMRSKTDGTSSVDGPVNGTIPAAPPLPGGGFAAPPPPPPPPPPIVPPTERIIVRKRSNSKNQKQKKPDSGPHVSMAEVMAKAKRMSEARSRAMSSMSNEGAKSETPGSDPFEAAVMLRSNLKRVQKHNTPTKKEEEEDNELKRAMQAKANRVSRLWQDNDNSLDDVLRTKNDQSPTNTSRQSFVYGSGTRSSTSSHSTDSEYTVTTIDVDNASNSSGNSSKKNSIQRNGSLHREQDVNDFVDSLFDPVLSNDMDELTDEKSVARAIKGGGGMNQPGATSPQTSTTNAGSTRPSTVSMTSPIGMNGTVYVPMSPVANGYPSMNGYPGVTPGHAFMPIMSNGPMGYSSPTPDVASLAAQQQILIEHLLSQQRLIQEQQNQLSQKSNEELLKMTRQHEEQLKTLQEQLNDARATMPNGKPPGSISNGPVMNGNMQSTPAPKPYVSRIHAFETPPPPPEFSDSEEHASLLRTIPPPPTAHPPAPPPPPPPLEEPIAPYPPPPLSPPPQPPTAQNNRLSTSATAVASAVAALEAKSPTSPTRATIKSIEVIQNYPSTISEDRVDAAEPERPQLRSRLSSSVTALALQEKKSTKKYNKTKGPYICAEHTTWKMSIRKELFSANEKLDNRIEQRLVFLQIVRDTYSDACCRMMASDRHKMKTLLQKYGITPERPHSSIPVEEIIIQTARELPLYFSRFYLATGQNELPDVNYIAVGEQGVHLVKREKISDELQIVNKILYEDLEKVRVSKNKLIISLKESKISVVTDRADEIKVIIDPYLRKIEMEAKYVRAMYDYVTQEENMLNFKKGDVIQIIDKPDLEEGWYFGIFAGRSGYFPTEYVTHMKEDPTAPKPNLVNAASFSGPHSGDDSSPVISRKRSGSTRSTKSEKSEYGGGTYSMMEFAMHNFRHGQEVVHRQPDGTVRGTLRIKGTFKQSNKGSHKNLEWTWKGLAELVKYSKAPLQASLLRLEGHQNKLAIDCFQAVMKFMGDVAMSRSQKDTDLVYFLIKTCRENPVLCDEVYCQLVKQVTSNKSTNPDSCSRGWRLMIILTSYVKCGDVLKPYLVKFLQSAACDPKREFHGAAAICEQNLMKTFKYGGRRTHPSTVELKQLVQGRQTKRQVMLLPGMISKMMKIQTCSTGYDVIKEMCNEMDLTTENDYLEYGLFSSVAKQTVMTPILTTDYVMDTIGQMEKQDVEFKLWFRRILWRQSPNFDNELYVNVIYQQILPDYLIGYLTGVRHERTLADAQLQNEVAELGALQLLARESTHNTPVQSDIDKVIPKYMQDRLRPSQWLLLVQDHVRGFSLTPAQARKRFLEIVSKWTNFGSTFFAIKFCSHPNVTGECISAVDKKGIHFIDTKNKHVLRTEEFARIISTRILVSDKKRFFLDLKIGDSMVQKVTRMETQEAKEIAALIYKYVNQVSVEMNRPNEGLAGVLRSQDLRL